VQVNAHCAADAYATLSFAGTAGPHFVPGSVASAISPSMPLPAPVVMEHDTEQRPSRAGFMI
jgi:hypothetical protein